MSLPKLTQPIFSLTLPSNGKKIRYRQFTVKEEKILLTAQAAGEKADMIGAFKQLINNCALDKIDIDSMASFDIEYFFLQLRSKSVGNIIKLTIELDDKKHDLEISLDKLQVHKPSVSNKILLDEVTGIGVVLRYPTFSMLEEMIDTKADDMADSIKLFKMIIDSIYDSESIYPTKDATEQELEEFILSLNNHQVAKIQEFMEDMPYVYIDAVYQVDGVSNTYRVRGIDSFFV